MQYKYKKKAKQKKNRNLEKFCYQNMKNREILSNNLSGKGVDMVADCSSYSSRPFGVKFFHDKFLATVGASRLYKVELNILVLLRLTNFCKTRDMFKFKKNIFITRMKYFLYSHVNDTSTTITLSVVARTFLLENGRGGKALGKRLNPDFV